MAISGRQVRKCRPGRDRQPSVTVRSPLWETTAGLTRNTGERGTAPSTRNVANAGAEMTATATGVPIWGAAMPTPSARSMVRTSRSARAESSASNAVTGRAVMRSDGSGATRSTSSGEGSDDQLSGTQEMVWCSSVGHAIGPGARWGRADTGRMGRSSYDDSTMWADTALNIEDVNAILDEGGRSFSKNHKAVLHFVRRVAITIRAYQESIRSLDAEIQDLRTTSSRMGKPPTLSAVDMFQYLSPEQQLEAAGPALQSQYDRLERAERAAEAAQLGAQSERNRLRFELGRIADDDEIGLAARQRIQALLEQMGASDLPARQAGVEHG